jgi:hypothetical protein
MLKYLFESLNKYYLMYNVIQFGHSQFALKRDLIKLKGRTSQLVSDLA